MSAIVTGAGGDIGRAIVTRLRAAGHALGALDISPQALDRIEDVGNGALHRVVADVRDLDSVRAAVIEVERALGPIDILINNAGGITQPSLRTTGESDWLADIELNLNGPFRCINAVQEGLIARGRGTIVNIASVNGLGVFGHPGYSAAKAGLIHLTKFCAVEFGKYGIRAVALCPGSVLTQAWEERARANPGILEEALGWYPSRDICSADDVAAAVMALLDPQLRLMNGAVISFDGGLTAGSDRIASLFTGSAV
ncbi:SDR family oxidoreductase [Sphingomonas koreensis]|nr:SDR family oxidoreductase [Sphingomonas koreensis]